MQALRAMAFSSWGMYDFGNAGFSRMLKNPDVYRPNDLKVDLSNKEIIVTGANAGLGRIVAQELAKLKGNIHMVCRNEAKGKEAVDSIQSLTSSKITLWICDMASPKSVAKFANDFSTQVGKLDVLVNNAGVLLNDKKITKDGVEESFATNILGTYLLTTRLLPLLQNSHGRVITVSSGGMYPSKLNTRDISWEKRRSWNGVNAYSEHKRAQICLTNRWSEKYPDVFFASMHPGWAQTPGVANSLPWMDQYLSWQLRSPEQGADTIVWLAATQDVSKRFPSGTFFFDRQPARQHLPFGGTEESPSDVTNYIDQVEGILTKIL